MNEFGYAIAGRAAAAGVSPAAMLAIQVLEKGQHEMHRPAAVVLVQEYGVGNASAVHHGPERGLDLFVSLYIAECHTFLIELNLTSSTR